MGDEGPTAVRCASRPGLSMTRAKLWPPPADGRQVSGKVKANIVVPTDASDAEIVSAALADPKVAKLAEGKDLVKSIVVKWLIQPDLQAQGLSPPCPRSQKFKFFGQRRTLTFDAISNIMVLLKAI